jgi:polar amino acid transport system substrate-binding protein
VAYAKVNGKEKALAEFSNRNGSFFRGELYIYAYDFNGTTVAHPVNPEKIGINRLSELDAKGNPFIRELRDMALNGSGFVQYYYINPLHGNAVEPKLGYVMKVDESWWLGSGIYGTCTAPSPAVATPTQDELVAFVKSAKEYALANGKEKAIAAFNNQTGPFVNGGLYIFAYDYNGTTLVLPYQPGLIGTNRMNITDANSVHFVRKFGNAALNGGGFVEYLYPDPGQNFTVKKKLSYIIDVDGSWYMGAGIYSAD